MYTTAYRQYRFVLEQQEKDEEYLALDRIRRSCEAAYQEVMQTLTIQQREIISGYIGICAEMSERRVEIACFCAEEYEKRGSG